MKIQIKSLLVGVMIFGIVGISEAVTILFDPIGDTTFTDLDISRIDYRYTNSTYTQTVYFNNQIDLNLEFWLQTSFTIYDEIFDYTRTTTANYYNRGDGTGIGIANGFNTQYGTTLFSVGSNFISAELIRSELYPHHTYCCDSWNVDPDSYLIVSAGITVVNGDLGVYPYSVISGDDIQNALPPVIVPVPEPIISLLLSTGLTGLVILRKKIKNI